MIEIVIVLCTLGIIFFGGGLLWAYFSNEAQQPFYYHTRKSIIQNNWVILFALGCILYGLHQ